MLHHHHCIRPVRNRRARHDLNRFTGFQRTLKTLPGPDLADYPNPPRHVNGSDREAIPHRAVERRIIAVGGNIFSEHARLTALDRDSLGNGQNA